MTGTAAVLMTVVVPVMCVIVFQNCDKISLSSVYMITKLFVVQ